MKAAARQKGGRRTSRETAKAPEPLDVSELTDSFGYLLRRLQLAYKKNFLRIADDDIQNGQIGALFLIGRNPGITPSQIAAQLGMEPAQVAVLLSKLELQRLVRRPSSDRDGRARPVHLTRLGQRHFANVHPIFLDAESSFVGHALDEEETRLLRGLLNKLLAKHTS